MDSKQLIPSNSGANRACFLSAAAAGREPACCSAAFFSCCLGAGFSACCCCCFWVTAEEEDLHERRVEKPVDEMSAGDELRMEKARILSMMS